MILRLDQIAKRYARGGTQKVALDGVSIELHRGEIMGIFGPSGAGKTTLLRIAAGLEAPDGGIVSYKGERLDTMSAAQLMRFRRHELGCVWAAQAWPDGLSVVEHVALPLLIDGCDRTTAERLARELLLACEVEQCADLPVEDLSDGERQLAAIARALVSEPRLLLVDGVVSSLAFTEQESVMRLLSSLAREAKVAVLVTGTDAHSLLRADPVLYLCDGRLASSRQASKLGEVIRFPAAERRHAAADA